MDVYKEQYLPLDVSHNIGVPEAIVYPTTQRELLGGFILSAGTYTYTIYDVEITAAYGISYDFPQSINPTDKILPGCTMRFYNNNIYTGITRNVELWRCVPQDFLISDFLQTINKMFNLYWEQDPDDPNNIIIKPYEYFYTPATFIDWNNKIEKKTINTLFSYDDSYNKYIFSYADADDYFNVTWKDLYKTLLEPTYGSRTEQNKGNQFLEDKTLEIKLDPFKPSCVSDIYGVSGYFFPEYLVGDFLNNSSEQKNTSIDARILYYNGTTSVAANVGYFWDDVFYTKYPQCSTLTTMLTPNANIRDLNFKTRDTFFDSYTYDITENNLYNVYWKNYIDSLNSPHLKIIEATVKLDETDLYKLKLSDTIIYDGAFWHINKLLYNVGDNMHSVQLFKVNDQYTDNVINYTHNYLSASILTTHIPPSPHVNNLGFNYIKAGPASMIGHFNQARNFQTSPESTVQTSNLLVVGDNNIIEGANKNVVVFGDHNLIPNTGLTNVNIFGSNITADTSNSTYIGGNLFVNGSELAQGNKFNVLPNDNIEVKPDFQYFIDGDINLSGVITTQGQVFIEDGDLIIDGAGDIEIIDDGELLVNPFHDLTSTQYYQFLQLLTLWEKGAGYNSLQSIGGSNQALGDYSLAEGYNVIASGAASHAEGFTTNASGLYSHAEGGRTKALGIYSHTEGQLTSANGTSAHAEGTVTIAYGISSHAEGVSSQSNGDNSHSEGNNTQANGESSHAEGIYSQSDGNYSHAEGEATVSAGDVSHAEGFYSQANGYYSHAEGYRTLAVNSKIASHVEGAYSETDGNYCHAEGYYTKAIGDYSHAEGNTSYSTGITSHAEGSGTRANGNFSHSEGQNTMANGNYSHAEGYDNTTTGNYSHIGGYSNDNNASNGFVVGNNNLLSGSATGSAIIAAHSITGTDPYTLYTNRLAITASGGTDSFTVTDYVTGAISGFFMSGGVWTIAHYNSSMVITGTSTYQLWEQGAGTGSTQTIYGGNQATGDNSLAHGILTTASGAYSHSEGVETIASGDESHAEGDRTIASGLISHAEGWNNVASGFCSHAEGKLNATGADSSLVAGINNKIPSSCIGSAIIAAAGLTATQDYTLYTNRIEATAGGADSIIVREAVTGTRYRIFVAGGVVGCSPV